MNKTMVFASIFALGYMTSDLADKAGVELISTAEADVAGMTDRDLRRDRDFKKAVMYVVSGNCYVDSGSVYC